jgi:hypothetical protein
MSKQYWHCDACGGNFDLGEKCDCDSPITPVVAFGETEEIDEILHVAVDISKNDIPCVTIARPDPIGDTISEIINVVTGDKARELYDILTGLAKTVRDPHDILESREDAANR